MIRAAVIGATGYAGAEVVRLLLSHPGVDLVAVTSERAAGKPYSEECPWIATDLVLNSIEEVVAQRGDLDVIFLGVEVDKAPMLAMTFISDARIIDLSAAHRLRNPEAFTEYYKRPWSDLTPMFAYGLPELVDAADIRGARGVANPGCHVTASLLGLAPLVRAGFINGVPVIDSKTGASGAGRAPKTNDFAFSELDGGIRGYGSVGHRHTPEIEQMVGPVRFAPHLIPVPRGLLATIYAPLARRTTTSDIVDLLRATYEGRPFVQVVRTQPSTKQVLGSNRCDIYAEVDERLGFATILSVIDNLGKGAAGQAVQNMNLMFDLPEDLGLPLHGVWP